MGAFSYRIAVGNPQGERFEELDALVDTGASYTTIATSVLNRLGVVPYERRQFRIADERVVERDIGITEIRIEGRIMPTVVVFDSDGHALLGAYTLEGFGLGVDPIDHRLIPVPGLLMASLARPKAHAGQAHGQRLVAGRR